MSELKRVGKVCQKYRKNVLRMSLKDVGKRLGYSGSNISAFENGYSNNAIILLWYMSKGVTIDMIMRG